MIANANRISVDDAFAVLRSHARNQRKSLRAVATAVVEERLEIT